MSPSLLERSAVLAAIRAAVDRARTGSGGAVFVSGGAGAGRTAVLEAAVGATPDDVEVRTASADEMESSLGFALLGRILPGVLHPDGTASDPTAPYVRALARLEAQDRPLLLTIDDLHWADGDSLAVLGFLARRLSDLPVVLVATLRPWPEAALRVVDVLAEDESARHLPLTPLSRGAARDLLQTAVGRAVSDDEDGRCWDLCRGNPALIRIAAGGIRSGQAARPPGDAGPGPALRAARFAGLDEDALRVARSAGVLGTSFRPGVAVAVTGLSDAAGDRALESLYASGLVVADGDRARFAQPLLARLLDEELVPAVRARMHARAFAELERRGVTEEAVEHALRADLEGDERAAGVLERVGRASLRRGAVDAAVRQLEAAVRLRGDRAGARGWIALAEARCAAGRAHDGEAAARRALAEEHLDREARVAALTVLGRCGYLAGAPDRGASALQRAAALATEHDPPAAIVALLHQASSAWATAGPAHALPYAAEARRLAAGSDVDPLLRENAEATWGSTATECGDLAGIAATLPVGRRMLGDLEAEGLTSSALVTPASSLYAFAHCAGYRERFDESFAALELARRRIEEDGAAQGLAMATLFVGNQRIRRGLLHAALADADRASRFSELTPLTTPVASAMRAIAAAWLGRREDSRDAADRALAAAPEWWLIRVWAGLARGIDALWAGDPAASDAFVAVEDALDGAGVREPNHTMWFGHAVAAHLMADRPRDAERVLVRLQPHVAGHPGRWPGFVLALGRGRVAEHAGDPVVAEERYRDALLTLGDADLPLQRAEGLLALGSVLRRTARAVEARPHLAEACRLAEASHAAPLAAGARGELQLAGGRRRAEMSDRDRLTSAELRVALAAASGRSNAEVARSLHLSVNTVSTHLKRTYAKLGIRGRGQLAGLDLRAHEEPVEPDGPGARTS